jgi:hypothetical protein
LVDSQEIRNILDGISAFGQAANARFDWGEVMFDEFEMTPIQELFYINECETNPEFADAITKDVTKFFKDYIVYRIKSRANLNLILGGEQGSGKSTFAFSLFLYIKRLYKEIRGIDLGDMEIAFTSAETLDMYDKLSSNAVILQDEDDTLQGVGAHTTIAALGNIIKRVRAWEISLMVCCPVLTTIPGCDYALIPFGYERKGAELYRDSNFTNSSKCCGRALLYVKSRMQKDKYKLMGCVHFFTGDGIQYMETSGYKDKKRQSFEKVKAHAGGSGSATSGANVRLLERAKKLCAYATKHGWDGNVISKLKTSLAMMQMPYTSAEFPMLKELAKEEFMKNQAKQLKKAQKKAEKSLEQKPLDPIQKKEFIVDDIMLKEIYQEYLAETDSKLKDRKLEIYINLKNEGFKPKDFTETTKKNPHKPITEVRVGQIEKEIDGFVNKKIGDRYELFYFHQVQAFGKYNSVIHDGGYSKPDIIAVLGDTTFFISVKCFCTTRNGYQTFYKDSHAEIEAAKEQILSGEKARVLVHILNRQNKKEYDHEIEQSILKNQTHFLAYKDIPITLN